MLLTRIHPLLLMAGAAWVLACGHGLASYSGKILTVADFEPAKLPAGEHVVEGYVITFFPPCAPCPEGAACTLCPNPYVLLSDQLESPERCSRKEIPCVFLDPPPTRMVEGRRYRLRVLSYEEPSTQGWPETVGAVLEAVAIGRS
jgi:hypothetical protein